MSDSSARSTWKRSAAEKKSDPRKKKNALARADDSDLGIAPFRRVSQPLPKLDASLVVPVGVVKPRRKKSKAAPVAAATTASASAAAAASEHVPSGDADDAIDLDADPVAVQQPLAELALDATDDAAAANGPSNFRMHVHLQLLMAFDFVGPNEAVAVQQPWLAVVRQLPPKLYRPRYGT